jgi:glycosyltransferase involved in cell wall biosynthesis
MKICLFTENYSKGGLDTYLVNLINAWPDANDEFTLICNGSHPGIETIKEKIMRSMNIEIYNRLFTRKIANESLIYNKVLDKLIKSGFIISLKILQYPFLLPWYIISLTMLFQNSTHERLMVINGGYPASLLCRVAVIAWKLAGKQPLATLNFHSMAGKPKWYYRIIEDTIDKYVESASRNIIGVSKACIDTIRQRKNFASSRKITYILNGIEDPHNESKNATCQVLNTLKPKKYCLMLSTYDEYKGYSFLMEAYKNVINEFPEIQLKIYGHGTLSQKKKILEYVKNLGLEGNVSLNEFTLHTAPLYSNASILVVPSQAHEAFGLTIIEAMAYGIPIVATDIGGIPEVLSHSCAGYTCPRNEPITFANLMIKILRDEQLAATLGRNGRKTFEMRFSANVMTRKYRELLI